MTLFRIVEQITCANSNDCHQKIMAKIEAQRGIKLHTDDADDPLDQHDGYLQVKHKQGSHLIIVNIYDDETKHEYVSGLELSEFGRTGVLNPLPTKSRTTESPKIKKATATLPTQKELEQDVKDRDVP